MVLGLREFVNTVQFWENVIGPIINIVSPVLRKYHLRIRLCSVRRYSVTINQGKKRLLAIFPIPNHSLHLPSKLESDVLARVSAKLLLKDGLSIQSFLLSTGIFWHTPLWYTINAIETWGLLTGQNIALKPRYFCVRTPSCSPWLKICLFTSCFLKIHR